MPYFTRQPYAAPEAPAEPADQPDILALAAEVLARETGGATPAPFRLLTTLRAGSAGRMILGFTAEDAPVSTPLTVTDLTGPGARIPAQNLRLDPPALHLAPGQSADVTVTVTAPQGLPPGLYKGLISAPGSAGFSAPIEVAIAP
jgi:hypothetical protein